MPATPPPMSEWRIALPDEAATVRLARDLCAALLPGDLVTLSGELGAGKTTVAREMIRALSGNPALEVPSPTFTLLQVYDGEQCPVVHADLFRVGDPSELAEIGWEEAAEGAIVIVEWPQRAGSALTADRLDVALDLDGEGGRLAVVTGLGAFAGRLERSRGVNELLERAGWAGAKRVHLLGDASSRAYERVEQGGESAILMIAPRRPDGPPIRGGRPYSAIAKLAESVHAFVAMAGALRAQGYSAPDVLAADLDRGLLLLEDFGAEPFVDEAGPIAERTGEAALLLADLHGRELPRALPIAHGVEHSVPDYDLDALLIEVELLLDWYAPQIAGVAVSAAARAEFMRLWTAALAPVQAGQRTWTLRDYHSPNLIWLPWREGVARVGLLDFQDAVWGHPAYDVASLLQDARVTVPPAMEVRLLSLYAATRRAREPAFDPAAFTAAYATLGAQRATKIAGIFARLDKRDGKPGYLRHLPRVETYLRRNLDHPALADLKGWYGAVLPKAFTQEAFAQESPAQEPPAQDMADPAGGERGA